MPRADIDRPAQEAGPFIGRPCFDLSAGLAHHPLADRQDESVRVARLCPLAKIRGELSLDLLGSVTPASHDLTLEPLV